MTHDRAKPYNWHCRSIHSIFAHERPSIGFWLASVIGAIIVLTYVYRQSGGQGYSIGDLFLLGAVLSDAMGYTLSGRAALAMGGIARVGQIMLLQPFVIVGLAAPVNNGVDSC